MAETIWTLLDSAPSTLGQGFDPPATESTAVYWGGPSSMAFAPAGVAATATPAGVSATTATSQAITVGAATAGPAGVSASSASGTATAIGAATGLAGGLSSAASVGTAVV